MVSTHLGNLAGKFREATSKPSEPKVGEVYYNTTEDTLNIYNGTNWIGALMSTTTSTSSSTSTSTTTSISTSTTSTSTSTTSTSSSTSTTTTL